ncbi:MAG: Na/Pi cotransporter family protein [Rhodobacteraceae bacterium]|nr:MAG: Na/Pi cotransporter family protein [Paracoccaceae bacterium]
MTQALLAVAGGLCLFLLGMVILTDGLRALAGPALRRFLRRFTRTPLSGAVSGALATATLQSSSATTLLTVGFVGAGLIGFPQALGLILGANLGTTTTGWLVTVLGFKLQLGLIAGPLALCGVLLRLFARGGPGQAGWALAGFGLLFMGIDALQSGMGGFEGRVTPDTFPPDTLFGRLRLVLIGVAITTVTQSSSAGVATALTAIAAGAISFPQAAAMVIGMDVATTFKTLIASAGGSAAMRRTAYAHVVYNLISATIAFSILDVFTGVAETLTEGPGVGDPQIALVAFHTLFNLLGVSLVLPFARPFARFIERLAPEAGGGLTGALDSRLGREPEAAASAATATARALAAELADALAGALDPGRPPAVPAHRLGRVALALGDAQTFVEAAARGGEAAEAERRRALHALDHLARLHRRAGQAERIAALRRDRRLRRFAGALRATLRRIEWSDAPDGARADRLRRVMRAERARCRDRVLRTAAAGALSTEEALARLDAMRWLHRVAYHLWRIAFHLGPDASAAPRLTAEARLDAAED